MTVPNKSVIAVSGWNKHNIYLSIYVSISSWIIHTSILTEKIG